jgi:hypothetical protein
MKTKIMSILENLLIALAYVILYVFFVGGWILFIGMVFVKIINGGL